MENGQIPAACDQTARPEAIELLKKAYRSLQGQDADSACKLLEQALDIDYENEEIKYALKCVNWWLEHTGRLDEKSDLNNFLKGGFLISLLKQYDFFLEQLDNIYDQCQFSIRCFVFSKALFFFRELLQNHENQKDPELLYMVSRCYKGLGNYDEALIYIEQAARIKREDAKILAETADINALLMEMKTAKALFREAFFIDPYAIEVTSLESALILKLYDEVRALGYPDDEVNPWMAIYGNIWKVFSVKRKLKQVEAGRLKQSIFSMEAEYEAKPSNRGFLKPKLLNHYFWLIDHYETISEDTSLIEETLLKIKIIDPEIFKKYTGS